MVCSSTLCTARERLPTPQLLALRRVELFLLLNSPKLRIKQNGNFPKARKLLIYKGIRLVDWLLSSP